jgi:hypothetical protein
MNFIAEQNVQHFRRKRYDYKHSPFPVSFDGANQ